LQHVDTCDHPESVRQAGGGPGRDGPTGQIFEGDAAALCDTYVFTDRGTLERADKRLANLAAVRAALCCPDAGTGCAALSADRRVLLSYAVVPCMLQGWRVNSLTDMRTLVRSIGAFCLMLREALIRLGAHFSSYARRTMHACMHSY
jgi:hypothetical protein